MRDSFIFYRSFFEAIKELDNDTQCEIYNAIMEYEFNKKEIELSKVAKSIFTLIKPQLDANNQRYENGKKGGRPKTETKPKENQNETNTKPNVNDNVNVNDNKKEINKERKFKKPTLEEIENYINEKNMSVNAKTFYEYFTESNWTDSKGNKVKSWKQKLITWNSYNKKPKEKDIPEWFDKKQQAEDISEKEQSELENILKEISS